MLATTKLEEGETCAMWPHRQQTSLPPSVVCHGRQDSRRKERCACVAVGTHRPIGPRKETVDTFRRGGVGSATSSTRVWSSPAVARASIAATLEFFCARL